jgi:hypothetical protein
MAAVSRRLVIDASVASAAGQTMAPASRRCREFLQAFLCISHRAAMTPLLREEWKRHQSLFARARLAAVTSEGKVQAVPDAGRGALVKAALATDKIVVSLDDTARGAKG